MSLKHLGYILLVTIASLLVVSTASAATQTITPGLVRVKLIDQAESLGFTVSGNYQLVDESNGKVIAKLKPGEKWLVTLQGRRIGLVGEGGRKGVYKGPVSVRAQTFHTSILSSKGVLVDKESAGDIFVINSAGRVLSLDQAEAGVTLKGAKKTVTLNDSDGLNLFTLTSSSGATRYRGELEFRVENDKLTAINELNIEDYLCGVVPSEVMSAWPEEVLKAQAVAARNYAMQKVETSRGMSSNLVANQYNQVYGGYDAETEVTNKAVRETGGVVMMCQGSLITAFFHSCSGGFTENSEDVWSGQLPYTRWKADPFDVNENHYDWQVSYTNKQLASLLTKAGHPVEKVNDIKIKEWTSSGARVKSLLITGEDDEGEPIRIEISNAEAVRTALGLKSSFFDLDIDYNKDKSLDVVEITGCGYGHGVGMSQYGAYGMARQGYNYQDILKYYYSGVTLVDHYGRSSSLR